MSKVAKGKTAPEITCLNERELLQLARGMCAPVFELAADGGVDYSLLADAAKDAAADVGGILDELQVLGVKGVRKDVLTTVHRKLIAANAIVCAMAAQESGNAPFHMADPDFDHLTGVLGEIRDEFIDAVERRPDSRIDRKVTA